LKGQTCGLHQRAEVHVKGRLHVTLDLKMYLDAPDPHDAIQIHGNPPIDLKITGGVAGDQATVAGFAQHRATSAASPTRLETFK
jgi:4-hydroxy-tetrahydrodipicolinate reductase